MAPRTTDPPVKESLFFVEHSDIRLLHDGHGHGKGEDCLSSGIEMEDSLLGSFSKTLSRILCLPDMCGASNASAVTKDNDHAAVKVHAVNASINASASTNARPSTARPTSTPRISNKSFVMPSSTPPSTSPSTSSSVPPSPSSSPSPLDSQDSFCETLSNAYHQGIFCCMSNHHDDKYRTKYKYSYSKSYSRSKSMENMISDFSDGERYYARRWNGHLPLVPMSASEEAVRTKLARLEKARIARGVVPSADPPPLLDMSMDMDMSIEEQDDDLGLEL